MDSTKHGVGLTRALNVSSVPKVDEPAAVDDYHRLTARRHRADGGGLVLLHAEIRQCRLSTDSARGVSSFRPRRSAWDRLPLLPQCSREVVVFERAGQLDLHEL